MGTTDEIVARLITSDRAELDEVARKLAEQDAGRAITLAVAIGRQPHALKAAETMGGALHRGVDALFHRVMGI